MQKNYQKKPKKYIRNPTQIDMFLQKEQKLIIDKKLFPFGIKPLNVPLYWSQPKSNVKLIGHNQ